MFFEFYQNYMKESGFLTDPIQQDCAKKIDSFISEWKSYSTLRRFFNKYPLGLYIYGGVGTGKTTLMDLMHTYVNAKKHREHSKFFLLNLQKNGFDESINAFKNLDFLFLDELEIIDIADAMIIKRLFESLNKCHVKIIVTSNLHPTLLYKNGLHFDRFEPFIHYIMKEYELFNLDNGKDYRYLNKNDAVSSNDLENLKNTVLTIIDKDIPCQVYQDGLLFYFSDLCEQALGPLHYKGLSQLNKVLYICNIPTFTKDNEDALRRFIIMVDMCYDQNIKLIGLPSPFLIFEDSITHQPTERLQSRLIEMNSL